MSLFVLDTLGNHDLANKSENIFKSHSFALNAEAPTVSKLLPQSEIDPGSEEEDDGDYGGLPPPSHDISHILNAFIAKDTTKKSKAEEDMEYAIKEVTAADESRAENINKKRPKYRDRPNKDLVFTDFDRATGKFADSLCETDVAKEMEKSNIFALETEKSLPQLRDKKLRDLRKIERSKNKGEGWFNMPATEVTEEVKNDLKILQMRSVLNPKHFYKKNDLKVLPKFFQIGTVQHSPLDHYKERDTRRNKKKTLVDELLADAEFQSYNKRKYKELIAKKDRYAHKKAMKKMKKLKKNK